MYCFVRHAEKTHKNSDNVAFRLDSDITKEGKQAAKAQAQLLVGKGFDRIVSSPYLRTRKTAYIYSKELKISDVVVDSSLSECLCNQKRIGPTDIRTDTLRFSPVGLETRPVYTKRMSDFAEKAVVFYGSTTIFVTHGLNIVVMSRLTTSPVTSVDMGYWKMLELKARDEEAKNEVV